MKHFQMIINHFFISQAHLQHNFSLIVIRDIKKGNGEQQIASDSKLNIYFKNNFILLVMSVTQLNFLN